MKSRKRLKQLPGTEGTMLTPVGCKPPYRIEVGTPAIGEQARRIQPNAEIVLNPALGEWGWMAFADKETP